MDAEVVEGEIISPPARPQAPALAVAFAQEMLARYPVDDCRRLALRALFNGYPQRIAAAQAGVSYTTFKEWMKKYPEFRSDVTEASEIGFGTTIETELYRRALAGDSDRGSMRALELVTRARDPQYRDKAQLQIGIIHTAMEAAAALVGDWSEPMESAENSAQAGV